MQKSPIQWTEFTSNPIAWKIVVPDDLREALNLLSGCHIGTARSGGLYMTPVTNAAKTRTKHNVEQVADAVRVLERYGFTAERANQLIAHPPLHNVRTWFCTKVSPGCAHCYAERLNLGRFGSGLEFIPANEHLVEPVLVEKELDAWRKRRTPATIFIGDMTDLFHPLVPNDMLRQIVDAMRECPHHVFQVLTKRPERLAGLSRRHPMSMDNVIWGTSIENQRMADERIPQIIDANVRNRFLSVEPMLGPIDLKLTGLYAHRPYHRILGTIFDHRSPDRSYIDQVIFGCESGPSTGPNARRPCHNDWIRNGLKQCREAGVPAFVKQINSADGRNLVLHNLDDFPPDLRVREYPTFMQKGGTP